MLTAHERISADDVARAIEPAPHASLGECDRFLACADLRDARRQFEIEFLTRKLREHSGNVTRTASAVGMARQSLQEKLRELGIERPSDESK